jgi:hypothetical protein
MQTGNLGTSGGIDPLGRYQAASKPVARKEKEKDKDATPVVAKDSVSISAASRHKRIDAVRDKLKQGFYDTEDVRDAVSEKLSGLFEKEE